MSSGFSALVAAIYLGPRRGFRKVPMPPHSLPLTVIGAALLWVGWFGFNAGSALAADGTAGLAFLNTSTATSNEAYHRNTNQYQYPIKQCSHRTISFLLFTNTSG